MELRQLAYFLQICEDGNFTTAAKKLFITQQALSKTISNLEEELNTPLFVRTSGRLTPTPECVIFEKSVRAALDELARAKNTLMIGREAVTIQFGLPHGMKDDMETLLQPFLKENPFIKLELQELTDTVNLKKLDRCQLDLSLTTGEDPSLLYPDLFEAQQLFEIGMCMLLPGDHPLASLSVIQPEDLNGVPIITTLPEYFGIGLFENYCLNRGTKVHITLNSIDRIECIYACSRKKGIYLYPAEAERIIKPLLRESCFVSLPFTEHDFRIPFFLVTRKKDAMTAPVRQFYQYLQKHLHYLHGDSCDLLT